MGYVELIRSETTKCTTHLLFDKADSFPLSQVSNKTVGIPAHSERAKCHFRAGNASHQREQHLNSRCN
jgi:hypothetical protein